MLNGEGSFTDRKYNQLQTDFRVEAVAANILKYYDGS